MGARLPISPRFARLDVTELEPSATRSQKTRPEVVLHWRRRPDVDRCEQEPQWAHRNNAVGTDNVARVCAEVDATLVYVSTGSVFSGDKSEPYVETDEPGPVNAYARAKLAGERAVTARCPRSFIVRAGWMMGGGPRDKKFVGMMTQFIRAGPNAAARGVRHVRTPTYARDLLGAIAALLGTRGTASITSATQGRVPATNGTRHPDALGRPDLVVEPVPSSMFPLPAPRPRSEAIHSWRWSGSGWRRGRGVRRSTRT